MDAERHTPPHVGTTGTPRTADASRVQRVVNRPNNVQRMRGMTNGGRLSKHEFETLLPVFHRTAAGVASPIAENQRQESYLPQLVLPLKCAVNATSISPNRTRIVLAGRDVLKLIKLVKLDETGEAFAVDKNLRVGRTTLTVCSTDVDWNPEKENIIATAAANGHVVIWDLSLLIEQKLSQDIEGHARTTTSVRWNPHNPNMLLSGAQDHMVKSWDMRASNDVGAGTTFNVKESVRQLAWSPHDANQFAVGLENGNVQIWDMRAARTCEHRMQAHQGPTYSVAWHPTRRAWLASGGRDKVIRVWDLADSVHAGRDKKSSPVCAIQTQSSVARVRWRPDHLYHITSCALVHDFDIHVWDIRRHYFPVLSFQGHSGVVADMIWDSTGSNALISTSKDKGIVRHLVQRAHHTEDDAIRLSSGASWNVHGDLCHFTRVPEYASLTTTLTHDSPTPLAHGAASASGNSSALPPAESTMEGATGVKPRLSSMRRLAHPPSASPFTTLAQQYTLCSADAGTGPTCLRNADVADACGQEALAQVCSERVRCVSAVEPGTMCARVRHWVLVADVALCGGRVARGSTPRRRQQGHVAAVVRHRHGRAARPQRLGANVDGSASDEQR
eukprot:m.36901 g.36901  ORF g.36901 m.36901 type:complete len:616 (-) comp14543_c0_seq1:2612-4459(-)